MVELFLCATNICVIFNGYNVNLQHCLINGAQLLAILSFFGPQIAIYVLLRQSACASLTEYDHYVETVICEYDICW